MTTNRVFFICPLSYISISVLKHEYKPFTLNIMTFFLFPRHHFEKEKEENNDGLGKFYSFYCFREEDRFYFIKRTNVNNIHKLPNLALLMRLVIDMF